jgi:hypothetical protein
MEGFAQRPQPREEASQSSRRRQRKRKARKLAIWTFETVDTPTPDEQTSALSMHAEVYAVGAKYQIAFLQEVALDKFKQEAETHWHAEQFVEAIDITFHVTPGNDLQLRLAVKTLSIQNYARLVDNADFAETVDCIDGLAFDLFRELCSHNRALRECCLRTSYYNKCDHQSFIKGDELKKAF